MQMLHISEKVRNITKDSPLREKLLQEMSTLVPLCGDAITALDHFSKSEVKKVLDSLPLPETLEHIGPDVQELSTILSNVFESGKDATYAYASTDVRRFKVELQEGIKRLE
jgi:hypothetical protein